MTWLTNWKREAGPKKPVKCDFRSFHNVNVLLEFKWSEVIRFMGLYYPKFSVVESRM